jgi:hypothetical protein
MRSTQALQLCSLCQLLAISDQTTPSHARSPQRHHPSFIHAAQAGKEHTRPAHVFAMLGPPALADRLCRMYTHMQCMFESKDGSCKDGSCKPPGSTCM